MLSKNILVGLVIVLLVGGFLVYKLHIASPTPPQAEIAETDNDQDSQDENNDTQEPPEFTWSFEEANSINLDGLPETDLFLEASYTDGTTLRKHIDTTPGSCNELPEADEGSLPGTANVQCYSAGLGYRYKITEGVAAYQVERLTFEEALPDYESPEYQYEVVAEF
jgi:hypothetical protein